MKKLKVTCKAADYIPFDSLEKFQGKLKKITKENLAKLKKLIILNGINVPFFIWFNGKKYRILDGHQRSKAIKSLRDEGWELPLMPVDYIEAENEKDARQKLLGITSQFGEFEFECLEEWLEEIDDDIKDTFRFVDEEISVKEKQVETEADDEVPDDVPAVTKLGDLWELGRHRVLCGKSR